MVVRDRGMARDAGFFMAGLLGLSMFVASCQQPKDGPPTPAVSGKPKLEVIGGETVDWGKQPPGTLKRTIKVVNTGGDTLRITDVHPSCGCTTAPLDKKLLVAGDTASIEVSMDMTSRSGPQHKTITISSNDSARPSTQITLTADIVRDIVAEPEVFPIINEGTPGKEDTTAVALINKSSAPVVIEPPLIINPAEMAVRFDMKEARTLQPGDTLRILAHAKPLTASVVTTDITIGTSSKTVPTMKIPLTVNATPRTSSSTPIVPSKVDVGGKTEVVTPGKTPAAKSSRK